MQDSPLGSDWEDIPCRTDTMVKGGLLEHDLQKNALNTHSEAFFNIKVAFLNKLQQWKPNEPEKANDDLKV